jgi:hypothetical protein
LGYEILELLVLGLRLCDLGLLALLGGGAFQFLHPALQRLRAFSRLGEIAAHGVEVAYRLVNGPVVLPALGLTLFLGGLGTLRLGFLTPHEPTVFVPFGACRVGIDGPFIGALSAGVGSGGRGSGGIFTLGVETALHLSEWQRRSKFGGNGSLVGGTCRFCGVRPYLNRGITVLGFLSQEITPYGGVLSTRFCTGVVQF